MQTDRRWRVRESAEPELRALPVLQAQPGQMDRHRQQAPPARGLPVLEWPELEWPELARLGLAPQVQLRSRASLVQPGQTDHRSPASARAPELVERLRGREPVRAPPASLARREQTDRHSPEPGLLARACQELVWPVRGLPALGRRDYRMAERAPDWAELPKQKAWGQEAQDPLEQVESDAAEPPREQARSAVVRWPRQRALARAMVLRELLPWRVRLERREPRRQLVRDASRRRKS